MSCHKNHMTTGVITLWHMHVNVIDNVGINNEFSYWNNVHFEGDKIPFKGAFEIQNLTRVVISYEIYETRRRLVSYEMTTRVRSSISLKADSFLEGLNPPGKQTWKHNSCSFLQKWQKNVETHNPYFRVKMMLRVETDIKVALLHNIQ